MRNFHFVLRKFFIVIFAILFVITSTFVMILYGPSRLLFQSGLYKRAFSDLGIYEKIPAIASNFLPSSKLLDSCLDYQENCGNTPTVSRPPSFLIKLAPEDWQGLLKIILPPSEIQSTTESALDNLFVYLHGNVHQISISTGMLKENLTGATREQGLHQFFGSLQPCSQAEATLLNVPYPPRVTVPLCRPNDESLNSLLPMLDLQLGPYINEIPDGIIISLPAPSLSNIRFALDTLAWMPLLPLLFLLGATLLGVRSFKSGLQQWGILLFISGLLSLGAGLAVRFEAKAAVNKIIGLQNTAKFTSETISLIRQLGEYLLYHLSDWIIYPALFLFLIGLLAWVGSALIQKKAEASALHPTEIPLEVS
jgi:hypothetical protein